MCCRAPLDIHPDYVSPWVMKRVYMRRTHREHSPRYRKSHHYTGVELIIIAFGAHVARLPATALRRLVLRSDSYWLSRLKKGCVDCEEGCRGSPWEFGWSVRWEAGGQSGCPADGMRRWYDVRPSKSTHMLVCVICYLYSCAIGYWRNSLIYLFRGILYHSRTNSFGAS